MSQATIVAESENKGRLIRWLRPFVFPFDTSTKDLARYVAVKHVSVSGKAQDVRTFTIPSIDRDEESQRAIEGPFLMFAEEIHSALNDDVEGVGGVQKYIVQALDESGKQMGRLPLRYSAVRNEGESAGEFDSEGANPQGLLAQLMRHNEATARISASTTTQLFGMMVRHSEQLAERCEALTARHVEMLESIEDLASSKHEREIEMEGARSSSETKNRLARQAEVLIPALAKRFAGVDLTASINPEVIEQREFIASLTEEDINRLAGVLDNDKLLRLMSMIQSHAAREETGLVPSNGAIETKGD